MVAKGALVSAHDQWIRDLGLLKSDPPIPTCRIRAFGSTQPAHKQPATVDEIIKGLPDRKTAKSS